MLLGHAACYWLSMITVQCLNKAKRHKKFIASISKDGPERSSSREIKRQSLKKQPRHGVVYGRAKKPSGQSQGKEAS